MDGNERVIMKPGLIIKHYCKGWFIPDITSSIPIDAVLKWSGVGADEAAPPDYCLRPGEVLGGGDAGSNLQAARAAKSLKMLRLLRMAKLFRLMRVGRIFRYIKRVKRFVEEKLRIRISTAVIKLTKLFIGLLTISHWVGCMNFMVCRLMEFPADSWPVNFLQNTFSDRTHCNCTATARMLIPAECSAVS